MHPRVAAFFRSPDFPGDEEKTRRGHILHVLLLATFGALALALLAVFTLYANKLLNGLIVGLVFGILLYTKWLNQRGHPRRAAWFYLATIWCVASVMVYLGSGTHSPELGAYFALTIAAGVLLGMPSAFLLSGLSCLALLLIALLEVQGHAFPRIFPEAPLVRWFDFTLFLFFGITPVYLMLSRLSSALDRARRENTQRRMAEEEIRASEVYFRSLIENAQDIITVLDEQGTIRFESPSIRNVLGYERNELVGRNIFELIHPEDGDALRTVFEEGLRKEGRVRRAEVRIRHRNGEWRCLEGIGQNLLHDPVVKGVVVNSRDVTQRKELEERYRQAQKMESIGRLAGGIAHDFNNLLVPILGYVELSLEQLEPEDPIRANLQLVRTSAERASSLTQQILAFSRKQVLETRVVDLNILVGEFLRMIQRLLGADIELRSDLSPIPCPVKVDPGMIEQVMMNLAVNARDAMPSGGILDIETAVIQLDEAAAGRIASVPQPGDYAMLSFRDTGHGMSESTRGKVFEPFFTTKQAGKGTGLGLATVLGIVEQHGGGIRLLSEEGKGTCIRVYLPLEGEAVPDAHDESADLPPGRGSECILVVEDDELVRGMVCEALASFGYRVLKSRNAKDALLKLAEERDIDLLLTDVILPGLNGLELAARSHAIRPDLRILFMTGKVEEPLAVENPDEGEGHVLMKPFTINHLTRKVREIFDGPA